ISVAILSVRAHLYYSARHETGTTDSYTLPLHDALPIFIANTESVIRMTHSFNARQRAALERCIRIMADGMARYQQSDVRFGLERSEEHTSELQSREKRVCRLLLEKKNRSCQQAAHQKRH